MLLQILLVVAQLLLLIASVGLVIFAFSCLPLPVPYLASRRSTLDRALSELNLQPGDVFYDIGSGDGRAVFAAYALQPQARCIGLEKRLGLYLVSRYAHWRMGSPANVEFRRGSFYTTSFPDATKVYLFLFTTVLAELEPIFERDFKNVTLVSCDFPLAHKQPARVITLEASTRDLVFKKLYVYEYGTDAT